MHPNWRALATLHIPLKRFVTEGATIEEPSSSAYKEKYKVANINAKEIKEFYQEVINVPETAPKPPVVVEKKTTSRQFSKPKVPFDQKKFFKAAVTNDIDTIRQFDYRGNDINSTDSFGWTALMMAACEGSAEVVETLICLGADLNARDKSGNTAYSLAEKKRFYNVLEIISKNTQESIEIEDDDEEDQNVIQKEFFCDVCRRKFEETSLRDHVTSTVHRFNMKKEKKTKNRFSIPSKNRGLKIMLKQGWDKESGLGPTNTGRLFPVKTVIRKPRTGLGTQQEPPRVTHFGAYDLNAIKYVERPKAKNRNDIRREKQLDWKRERRLRRELS
ncbi:G patch domain and ankyrin repeat-containing protein 1 homolog [Episyrphus balteatus]|uniref:G patch domain and ankyrin repeat-containing protein 1 homolog n=1 Tax=Episyrphus balteatus TaxID=286459 RepID=UPI0024861148|nr:G patch domain and ankyrin repeat-containing protein 1 homolog [Episyrphus balteatus]